MNPITASPPPAPDRVWQKLVTISVFFILPNALMLYFFITGLNANIHFARLEQMGIEYQRPLEKLLELIPRHALLAEDADAPVGRGIAESRAEIDVAIADLIAVDGRLGVDLQFTDEGLGKRAREHCRASTLRAEWEELCARPAEDPAGRHEHLLADVRTMITHAGDMSNLILDPDLDSYYLMDVTLLALPQTQHRLAQVIHGGTSALRHPETFDQSRRQLAIHAALLRESDLDRIRGSVETALKEDANFYGASATFQTGVPPAFQEYSAATEAFIALTSRMASSESSTVTPQEYLASGIAAATSSGALWTVAARELNVLLQRRIDFYEGRRELSLMIAGGAALAAALFVTLIARSITRPLRAQAGALADANDGLRSEVADRARAETSLRDSEARVRAVVDTALDGVVTMDAGGRIVGWNSQAETIFGWKRDEAIGRSLSETIVPPQHREAHERGLKQFMASGHGPVLNQRIEITAMRRDGTEIDVELAITPLKMDGRMEFSAFLRDITERKRAEEERQRLVDFLEASVNEVYVFDTETLRFSYVNRTALQNLGYAAAEVLQMTPLNLKPEFTEESFRCAIQPLLEGQILKHVFQTIHRRADGSEYAVEVSLQMVSTRKERVFLAVVMDITERTSRELELAQAQLDLMTASRQAGMAEVATGVLHNVGNVLNSVNVTASLITDKVRRSKGGSLSRVCGLLREHAGDLGTFLSTDPKGKQVPAFLDALAGHLSAEQKSIQEELSQLTANIDHIKDIVAMQQSYATVAGMTENLNPVDLIEDALRMNAGSFERHELELVREFGPDLPRVSVDKHKVLQILINLLRNAKYACDDSGRTDKRVTVRAAWENGSVRITVADNGVGIPQENLTRIFNHGFTTRDTGHGFGLHSGANAAKEMRGSLSSHSDGPGLGAAFTLQLPAEPAHLS